jgi:hypothetical protein
MRKGWLVLLLWALALASPARGEDRRSDAEPADEPAGWQFEVMPYVWLPGTFGTVEVKGRTATVDTTIGDVLTLLWHGDAFTLGGYFAARYDRWSLFADAYGGFLDTSASEIVPTRFCNVQVGATARLKPVIADVAVGYELLEYRVPEWRRPISLGVYLGTRIVHLGVDLETSAGVVGGIQGGGREVSNSFTTATPMFGVRWEIPVHDQVSFDFRGDLGGLPGGDRLNWSFLGDVRYWLDWSPWGTQPWLEAGYRVVGFNHDFGGGNDLALQLRGPLLAMGFGF